jgi:hypothetical protein
MQPQGQSPINEAYFAAQQAAFAACKLCSELQAQVDEVFASLQATQTAIEEQIAALLPMQVLLEIPTTPAQAVTWIQNFITTYLAPGLAAYNTYIAQLAALATQVADLITAIQNAEAQIEGCTITIPPLT